MAVATSLAAGLIHVVLADAVDIHVRQGGLGSRQPRRRGSLASPGVVGAQQLLHAHSLEAENIRAGFLDSYM